MIKVGEKFRLKRNVTERLISISYSGEVLRWVESQKFFVKVATPSAYSHSHPDSKCIWFKYKEYSDCYFDLDMVEPLIQKLHNHPLTSVFK